MPQKAFIFIRFFTKFFHLLLLEILTAIKAICNIGKYSRTRNNNRKKIVWIVLLFLFCFLIYFYSIWNDSDHMIKTANFDECLQDHIRPFTKKIANLDAFVSNENKENIEKSFFPMVGNGHFGCSFSGYSHVVLRNGRSLSWPLHGVRPLMDFVTTDFVQERSLLDIVDGAVYRFKCHKLNSFCMKSSVRAYAHRTRPNLLVQDIEVSNPTDKDWSLKAVRPSLSEWVNSVVKDFNISYTTWDNQGAYKMYKIYYQLVRVPRDQQQKHRWIVIAEPVIPSFLLVLHGQRQKHQFITVIAQGEDLSTDVSNKIKDQSLKNLLNYVEYSLKEALKLTPEDLFDQHREVWNGIWKSGLYVSPSLAPGSLNGHEINTTVYYILSHTPAANYEWNVSHADVKSHYDALRMNDRCFDGHDTFHVKDLWTPVSNEIQAEQLVSTWILTLEKQGCSHVIKAGLDGVMLSVLLSMGSLEFSGQHLEFSMNPNDLHRLFHFRGIRFNSEHSVDVWVELDEDNRPTLQLSTTSKLSSKKLLYACEAVCAGGPQVIRETGLKLPILLTKPRTPLFYLSDSQQHLIDLKRAVHVREVNEAPAHGHELIALHRHGHAFGGLPMIFWFAIVLLVALFHLFLCRLVYQEYWVRGEGAVSNLPPAPAHPARYTHRYRFQPHVY